MADAGPGHSGLAQASFRRPLSLPSSRYSGQNPLLAVAAMIQHHGLKPFRFT